jgi:O-antigen/teichoic acid export membrane protein
MAIFKKLLNKHTLALASNAVMPVMGMVTVSLLARNLTTADFGNWILFLIAYSIANFSRSGFLQTALIKFCAGANNERALNVIGSVWVLAFTMAAALGVICFTAYIVYHGDPATVIIIKWFSIIFLCTVPSSVALWILSSQERFDRAFILQFVGQGSFLITVLVLILAKLTSFENVIYAYCFAATCTSLFSLFSGWSKIRAMGYKSWICIKEVASFGKYSVGTSISSYLLRGSDTFIIKFMFIDPSVVGIYYLPQRLMEVIEIPLRSFVATAMPAMSAAIQNNDKQYMTHIMKKHIGILTILLIPVTIVAFIGADLIIEIIGGQNFIHTAAANVFRIFMCFAILLPIDRFFGITLDILNKPEKNMTKVFIMLIVNVAGDFLGIYILHNIYGVAIASIFTFLIGIIYGYWQLKQNLNFTIKDILSLGFTETKLIAANLLNRIRKKTAKQLY